MTTIHNAYVIPEKEEDWNLIVENTGFRSVELLKNYLAQNRKVLTANQGSSSPMLSPADQKKHHVPVSFTKFLDLFHDRIAGWRLKEVGFLTPFDAPIYRLLTPNHIIHVETRAESGGPFNPNDIVRVDGGETSITTFTELLTLIKFLTSPTK